MKKEIVKGVVLIFFSTILFHETVLPLFLPKIETYIQGEVINFYESFTDRDAKPAYVEVYNFKSFAHLYYTDKHPVTNPKSRNKEWLMNGNTDRDVYLVTKIGREETLEAHPNFKRVGGQYGYAFYKKIDNAGKKKKKALSVDSLQANTY